MTVSSTTQKIQYTANGSQDEFPYTFKIFEDDDLVVIVTDNGTDTTQTLNTDYVVSDAGEDAGGNVGFTNPPSAGRTITIYRELDLTQETDYVENDPFPAETHESALDRNVFIAQQQQGDIDRSVKFPITDPDGLNTELPNQTDRASQFLAFDASGEAIAALSVDEALVSSFWTPILEYDNAATSRITLGALGTADVNPLYTTGIHTKTLGVSGTSHIGGDLLLNNNQWIGWRDNNGVPTRLLQMGVSNNVVLLVTANNDFIIRNSLSDVFFRVSESDGAIDILGNLGVSGNVYSHGDFISPSHPIQADYNHPMATQVGSGGILHRMQIVSGGTPWNNLGQDGDIFFEVTL